MNPFKLKVENPSKINDTDFEEYYPRINTNTEWASFLPYINDATDKYIIPYIGEAFAEHLIAQNGADSPEPVLVKALVLFKRASAYYTAMYAYPKEQDLFSDLGAIQPNGERFNSTSIASFKSKLWDLTLTADDHLDALLQYLEIKVKGGDTKFNLFKNSDAFKNGKTDLFTHTFQLQEFHNIRNSRRTYLALLPALRDAVDTYIIPKIGVTTYNAIVELSNVAMGGKLLDLTRRMLVKYALVIASDTEGLLFDNELPVRVVSNPDGMDNRESQITARMNARSKARASAENTANQLMLQVCEFLAANPTLYPAYTTEILNSNNSSQRINRIVVTRDSDGSVKGGIMF